MADFTIPNYVDGASLPMRIGEYWYDELTGEIFTTRTMLHPILSGTNYKIIYPEISKFTIKKPDIKKLYPRSDGLYQTLSAYSFFGTGQQINIKSVDRPLISYNKQTKTFVHTFLGSCIAEYKYLFTYYLKRGDDELFSHNIDCIKPDLDIINIPFTDWTRMSGEFVPSEGLRPFDVPEPQNDLVNFETALTAQALTACDFNVCEPPNTDPFAHGQLSLTYAGEERNDGMNTIWLGCSAVEYSPGLIYPFPGVYNTSYVLPQQVFNIDSDIEVYAEVALYHPMHGESNRAVYTTPTSGWSSSPFLSADGTYTPALTTYDVLNSSGLNPAYKPGNGFSIFFYDADFDIINAPQGNYAHDYDWTGGATLPWTNFYPMTGFFPGGVGESLGFKPYNGPAQWDPTRPSGLDDCLPLQTRGMPNGYVAIGFDVAGGFATTLSAAPYSTPLTSSANCVVLASGPWNNFNDLDIVHMNNKTIHQELTGSRQSTLEVPIYRVQLEECGTRIKVAIKAQAVYGHADEFIEYIDYKMSASVQSLLPAATAIKAGLSFSTSDKVMTCELKSFNVYGRYTTNDIYKTVCGKGTCTGTEFISETVIETCPVSADIFALRAENTFIPIVSEGQPLGYNGLNYIIESYEDATSRKITNIAAPSNVVNTGGGSTGGGSTGGSSGGGGGSGY